MGDENIYFFMSKAADQKLVHKYIVFDQFSSSGATVNHTYTTEMITLPFDIVVAQ